ncbi:carbonic anhydrase Nec1-like [Salvia miltiorrhiza]|uniref:carbonic anhydrase Nec1-like n=1 Tax=Salvia miltiorrhiza TaxID=226208 RepID=UPI0025ACA8A5|nr:carbonic anhydrase Nec1-like [Salvia miltiorrhiza]
MKNLDPILIVLLILIASESTSAQEVEDEREFEYAENGEKGPTKWGEMKKEWSACSNGSLQSPIDMSNERVRVISQQEKKIKYTAANATLKNRGHDIQIQWFGDAGSVVINGSDYPLRQAHWHSPSEHTIHGRSYDMELHLVHLSTDPNLQNNIYVLGVLYKIGKPDKFLTKLITNIRSMIDKKGDEVAVGMIDATDIQVHNKKYYRYMGSLTVPPCTERVIWTINKKVKTVSVDQVKLLREAVHDYAEKNARPLQPKNSREIFLYSPVNANS